MTKNKPFSERLKFWRAGVLSDKHIDETVRVLNASFKESRRLHKIIRFERDFKKQVEKDEAARAAAFNESIGNPPA